jgi:hypothetical protein
MSNSRFSRPTVSRVSEIRMFFSRNKPQWLYNALPALYLVIGVTVIASVRNRMGLISGSLMIVAAIAILYSRKTYRASSQDSVSSRHSSIIAPPSRLAATTEFVRAIIPPKLGHRDIDRQHRSLASKTATLRVAFAHNDDQADIEMLIDELIEALARHLQSEAAAMKGLGVTRSEESIWADREQLSGAEADLVIYRSGGMTLEALIDRVAGPLVAGHLMSGHPPLPSIDTALKQLRQA